MEINKNKKALSEIISYVLIIMIALAIAGAVFTWVKYYVPSENERATCPESVSLFIENYKCNPTDKEINITIQNKGLFDIAGFYIRGSSSITKKPITSLSSNYPGMKQAFGEGKYDFGFTRLTFSPNKEITTIFSYSNLNSLATIQLQPYTYSTTTTKTMILCPNTIQIDVENC